MTEQSSTERPFWGTVGQTPIQNYLLSLPERALRSAAALVGGSSLILTKTLFPEVVKDSTTYQIFIGNLQAFVITRIAQVQSDEVALQPLPLGDDYLPRKVAGSVLELVGLMTIRFSPVWVFAIAGDAAGGGKVFLGRLVEQLKINDVIPQNADPENLVELLDAVQVASRTSARAVDTPPLSQDELTNLADELTTTYGRIFSKSQSLLPRFESLQNRMEQIGASEGISFEEVSGIMAVDAARLAKNTVGATVALGATGTQLLGEQILDSYARTLDEISQQGAGDYLGRHMKPFLQAAVNHLDPDNVTWTESTFLDG